MSNHLAIATVTATLRSLVQAAINVDVAGASVTAVRPTTGAEGLTSLGVNIYFYQAVPNAAWRNADLPTRSGPGALAQRPTIPLDLHYLFTFHGDDGALEPQRLMGSTVRALHARPVLTADAIRAMLETAELDDPASPLLGSDLADDVERVKLTPVPLDLEALSKLWSVMLETPYTLCMAYAASVVRLEADETPRRALPVRERFIAAAPFQRARVERAESEAGPGAAIEMGDTVVLRGSGLGGAVDRVRVGPAEAVSPVAGGVTSTAVRVALTDAALRAGVVGVQIVYENGATSNVAPLVLRPRVTVDIADAYRIDLTDVETDPGDGTHSATVGVALAPELDPGQRVELLLNELRRPSGEGAAYRFPAEERGAITDTATFAVRGVATGTYLLRVDVGGAETVLEVETDDASPDFGYYVRPALTLP